MNTHVTAKHIKKKSGGLRTIHRPSPSLRKIQSVINRQVLQPIPLPENLHGGVPGKSTISHAQMHVNKDYVVTLDIESFYPAIHYTRVYDLFVSLGFFPDAARLLTKLTTYDYHLAQGFPTSAAIANLVLASFWPRIDTLLTATKLDGGMYQDDLAISGGDKAVRLVGLLGKIFDQEGLPLNLSKAKKMHRGTRQEVTGWIVNIKLNAPKEEYRRLRAALHNCRIYGIESVAHMPLDRFGRHLLGRIQRVSQVNGNRGSKLLDEYRELPWPDLN